jgi:hypothetical protein
VGGRGKRVRLDSRAIGWTSLLIGSASFGADQRKRFNHEGAKDAKGFTKSTSERINRCAQHFDKMSIFFFLPFFFVCFVPSWLNFLAPATKRKLVARSRCSFNRLSRS